MHKYTAVLCAKYYSIHDALLCVSTINSLIGSLDYYYVGAYYITVRGTQYKN